MKMEFVKEEFESTFNYLRQAYREMNDFVVFPKDKPAYDGFEIDAFQTYCSAKFRAERDGLEIEEIYPLLIEMEKIILQK